MVAISVSAHARIRCEQVSTYFLGTFFLIRFRSMVPSSWPDILPDAKILMLFSCIWKSDQNFLIQTISK